MKAMEKMSTLIDRRIELIQDYLDHLNPRERVLVVFTTIFVIVAAVGSALWYMHAAAEKQQKRVNDLKDLVVVMQSHAVTMKPANDLALSAADKIQRSAQQQGLAVSSQQNGEQIQIVAEHQNYAVLANFLMQLSQMGLSIEKMDMVSNAGQIKLTATVQ